MKFMFDSQLEIGKPFEGTGDQVRSEPMLFNCAWDRAYELGGPITRNFLDALPWEWKADNLVVDTRVHMLMTGWYPCIPGWHHDDVPRSRSDGQPDYLALGYKSQHIMGLVNGDIAPTEFASGIFELEEVPLGETVYKIWDKEINNLSPKIFKTPSNVLIHFDWQSFHQGVPCIRNGWRWFGRVSRNTERVNNVTNEVRSQVQVYLPALKNGW